MTLDSSDLRTCSVGSESPRERIGRLLSEAMVKAEGEERDAFLGELDSDYADCAAEVRSLAHWGHVLQPYKDPVEPAAGAVLGGYELVSVLGSGGFGVVWRAKAREAGLPDVALKIVKAGLDTEAVLRRFQREREVLARLKHSGVAAIQDGGRTGGGRPFIVMELVPGEPITEFASKRGYGHRRAVQLLVRVCRAVEHAHAERVLHRDLKPSNILVAEEDGEARPKVIDFGIASVLGDDPDLTRTRTIDGRPVGTPGYMSPEQAGFEGVQASGRTFDGRTDVFALGRILFELVTGEAAVDLGSATDVCPSLSHKVAKRLDEAFERGAQSPRRVAGALGRPAVARDLDAIIQHAMETQPDRRYRSVAALRADLESFLAEEPVVARPPGAVERARRFGRRHRPVLLPAAVLVASLGASLVYVSGAQRRVIQANERLTKTVAVQSELIGNVDVARMGSDMRDEMLAQLGLGMGDGPERAALLAQVAEHVDFTGLARGVVERNVLDPAESVLEEQFGDDLESRQVVTETIMGVRKRLGLFQGRGRTAEALHKLAVEAYGEKSLGAASTLVEMGRASMNRGLAEDAQKHFEGALRMYDVILGPRSKEGLVPRESLARIELSEGDQAAALQRLTALIADAEAMAAAGAAGAAEGLMIESAWLLIAHCHERSMDFRLALEACKKAEALVGAQPDAGKFRRLEPQVTKARIQAALGRTKESLALLEKILPEMREELGETHPRTLTALAAAASARFHSGDIDGALEATELIYAAKKKRLTAAHPEALRAMANRLKMLNVLGRYDEADALGKESARHARNSISGSSEVAGELLVMRAMTLAGLARLDECMEYLEEGVAVFEACLPEGHARRQIAYAMAAQFYLAIQGMRPDEDFSGAIAKYQGLSK